jgi:hypothetical protein
MEKPVKKKNHHRDMKSRYNEEMVNAQFSDELLVGFLENSLISQKYTEDQSFLAFLQIFPTETPKGLDVSEKRGQEQARRVVWRLTWRGDFNRIR